MYVSYDRIMSLSQNETKCNNLGHMHIMHTPYLDVAALSMLTYSIQ